MAAGTVDQGSARYANKATAKQRRDEFRPVAQALAGALDLPAPPLTEVGRLPAWAVWTADQHRLAALVPGREEQRTVDLALAYALAHAHGRPISLVLPEGHDTGTRIRAAFLDHDITVFTHHNAAAHPVDPLTRVRAAEHLREHTGLRHDVLTLGRREPWVSALLDWADQEQSLTPAHRSQYLSWHALGMQVLKVQPLGQGLRITAGIHYSNDQKKPVPIDLDRPLWPDQLGSLKARVRQGVAQAQARTAGPYKEHLLQEHLLRQRDQVGWSKSDILLREFPVRRPSGGTGYIDFLRIDQAGTLHIIETKIGQDEFLTLQGLDYWIWAQANADLLNGRFPSRQTWDDPAHVIVDYILGDEHGPESGRPILSRYTDTHLRALPRDMRWQLHRAHPINSGNIQLESLAQRQNPPAGWTARRRSSEG